jgi:hypothetical protein
VTSASAENSGGTRCYRSVLTDTLLREKANRVRDRRPTANRTSCRAGEKTAHQFVREPLRAEEADRLANACQSVEEKLIVWSLLDTGLRGSELCSLTLDRIRWQQRAIRVAAKAGPHGTRRKQRIVLLSARVRAILLPKLWGSGKHASADGMKWDLYERNLLSERHVRYGGYGGIGYYHVSDTYVALFSHFIPCGVWEAVYILDGLLKNRSDIQPDTVHADPQGQATPVFGLAYLLGIDLMPRIRNWKGLTLFRPSKTARYKHIDSLFTDAIDWSLIETHLPDMLRVVLSIRAGRISAPTLLRKLGTHSRKNRLYQAFQEPRRVVRTTFL